MLLKVFSRVARKMVRELSQVSATANAAAKRRRFRNAYGTKATWILCEEPHEQSAETRWQTMDETSIRLTIVAVSYRQPLAMLAFLHSLNCQTRQSFKVHLLHDGPHEASREALREFARVSRYPLHVTFTDGRFNDWGHSLRSIGLETLDTEFVALTNADNYYVPRFVELALDAIDRDHLDFLHWDMVHSHDYPAGRLQRSYTGFETEPYFGHIDMGAFLVKSHIARRTGFNHRSFAADGYFVEELLRSGGVERSGHLAKILFVHN
jgi:hypothetical protein